MTRIKLRLTKEQGTQLEALSAEIGLRPSQTAQRLLLGGLSRVPAANRQLYQVLARTAANLTQLSQHLDASAHPRPELHHLVALAAFELAGFRRRLLGLPEDGSEEHETLGSRSAGVVGCSEALRGADQPRAAGLLECGRERQ